MYVLYHECISDIGHILANFIHNQLLDTLGHIHRAAHWLEPTCAHSSHLGFPRISCRKSFSCTTHAAFPGLCWKRQLVTKWKWANTDLMAMQVAKCNVNYCGICWISTRFVEFGASVDKSRKVIMEALKFTRTWPHFDRRSKPAASLRPAPDPASPTQLLVS